jgi:hypothetical protein
VKPLPIGNRRSQGTGYQQGIPRSMSFRPIGNRRSQGTGYQHGVPRSMSFQPIGNRRSQGTVACRTITAPYHETTLRHLDTTKLAVTHLKPPIPNRHPWDRRFSIGWPSCTPETTHLQSAPLGPPISNRLATCTPETTHPQSAPLGPPISNRLATCTPETTHPQSAPLEPPISNQPIPRPYHNNP